MPKQAKNAELSKNQHYVPQSYLSRFAIDGKICAYDKFKKGERTYRTNLRNVASESHFYDIPAEVIPPEMVIDSQFLEKMYSKMEGDAKVELDCFIKRIECYNSFDRITDWFLNIPLVRLIVVHLSPRLVRYGRIIERQKQELAFHMTQQILRTRDYRNLTSELEERTTQAVLNMVLRMRNVTTQKDAVQVRHSDTQKKMRHIQLLIDPEVGKGIFECLTNHIWMIGVNFSSQPLFTSDNPIVRHAHQSHPFKSNFGYCSPGIEIVYPLTPSITTTVR